jgi:hypothetical protein
MQMELREPTDTGAQLTYAEGSALLTLPVAALKKKCQERGIGSASWRNFATKPQLIRALELGVADETEGPSSVAHVNLKPAGMPDPSAAALDALKVLLGGGVNKEELAEQVREAVAEAVANIPPREIKIVRDDREPVTLNKQHKAFGLLLGVAGARDHKGQRLQPWLKGPAGSGKTHACASLAKALGLQFFANSVCEHTTKGELLGLRYASGEYIASTLRQAWENGGVYLLDEVDKGNPNVLAVLNLLCDSMAVCWPDGETVERHMDFILVCAGNTSGNGADSLYVGSNRLDEAFCTRFVQVQWDWDEELESELAGNRDWVLYIQRVRNAVAKLGLRHCISPRMSIQGAALIRAGVELEKVREMVIWARIKADDRIKIVKEL